MHKIRLPQTVERKIYFFRMVSTLNRGGRPAAINVVPALAHIAGLPFNDTGRYLVEPDGDALCCWVDGQPIDKKVRFGLIRRDNLPQVENNGNVSPLTISAAAGLAEVIHVRFFDNNIAGMDFNFHGPRISRLSYYLRTKCRANCQPFSFCPLLRQDAAQQLQNLRSIRLFHLKIKSSYIQSVMQADQDLGSALRVANQVGDADDVEIVLRSGREKDASLSQRLIAFARRMLTDGNLRSNAAAFQVRGRRIDNQKVDTVDLLRDHLISNKRIAKKDLRSRAVDTHSAYQAIEEAYRELRNELIVAPELQP